MRSLIEGVISVIEQAAKNILNLLSDKQIDMERSQQKMILFKCVRERKTLKGNQYLSVMALGDAKIKYLIGEKVTSPQWLVNVGYYPLVFDTIQNARSAKMKHGWYCQIWECKVLKEDILKSIPCSSDIEKLGQRIFEALGLWPHGTLMVKNLTLTKFIE